MSDPFAGTSEADYMAGRRRPNGPDSEAAEEQETFEPGSNDDRASLRPISVAELLRRPTPKWLVRGLLPERGFGVVFGASGSGKTFAALDLACGIARGEHWFGRRVQRGGVIYVAAEGHLLISQ